MEGIFGLVWSWREWFRGRGWPTTRGAPLGIRLETTSISCCFFHWNERKNWIEWKKLGQRNDLSAIDPRMPPRCPLLPTTVFSKNHYTIHMHKLADPKQPHRTRKIKMFLLHLIWIWHFVDTQTAEMIGAAQKMQGWERMKSFHPPTK